MPSWIQAVQQARVCRQYPAFCVQYASQPVEESISHKVVAIAIYVLGLDQTKLISLDWIAEREELSYTSPALEMMLFDEFHCYLERMQTKYPGAWWFHWAMRDANFGWPVLEQRSLALLKRTLPLETDQFLDFHAHLAQEYGRDFVPRPQLLQLAELNGCNTMNTLSGMAEMQASAQGDDDLVQRSAARKAELLGHLLMRFADGKLLVGDVTKRHRPRITTSSSERSLLNAVQASRFCGISRATWYRLLAQEQSPLPIKIGKRSLWDSRELELWIEADCPPQKTWRIERVLHGFSRPG